MAQQINLLTPILAAPRRHFSALAMLQAGALLLLGMLAISLWLGRQADLARRSHAAVQAQTEQERRMLIEALARLPQSGDPKLLEQQLAQLEQQNNELAQQLQALRGGLLKPGHRYSDLLGLLARSVPEPVWLSELRWQPGHLAMQGGTLDPLPLRAWVVGLGSLAPLQGLQIQQVRLEKTGGRVLPPLNSSPGSSTAGSSGSLAGLPAKGPNSWAFEVLLGSAQALPPTGAASQASTGGAR
ncbi:hypothetical protein RQP53_05665 [Paucibacter sp. APW11]|uniref:Fimbrial assembly protein n=1 Tax=Roseateles aquae TaxID=3077235 RepID=A0ABU3P857_9BURK|nr:hypothetical protein [Paucibacter sp. APW11]MDT8998754.1 hypothetical protein [Paucibacter sp. APW11]